MDVTLGALNSLKDHISDEELNRAKNYLKMNVIRELENPTTRLEEISRNYQIFGSNFNFHKYSEIIDNVTS
jgi:predicted Zn-dependent peptidase